VVYRISGAFFFGATAAVSGVLERIGRPRVFVLDFSDVPMVDSTGAKTLKRLAEKLALTGTLIFIIGASLKVWRSLRLAGLSKPMIRYAKTADHAVRFFHGRLGQAATA
jgi:sulfate permease, SulP family